MLEDEEENKEKEGEEDKEKGKDKGDTSPLSLSTLSFCKFLYWRDVISFFQWMKNTFSLMFPSCIVSSYFGDIISDEIGEINLANIIYWRP